MEEKKDTPKIPFNNKAGLNKFIEGEEAKIRERNERKRGKNARTLLARGEAFGFKLNAKGEPLPIGKDPEAKRYHVDDLDWWFRLDQYSNVATQFFVKIGFGDNEKEIFTILAKEWLVTKSWLQMKEGLEGILKQERKTE